LISTIQPLTINHLAFIRIDHYLDWMPDIVIIHANKSVVMDVQDRKLGKVNGINTLQDY
jgi:hypothetical protein